MIGSDRLGMKFLGMKLCTEHDTNRKRNRKDTDTIETMPWRFVDALEQYIFASQFKQLSHSGKKSWLLFVPMFTILWLCVPKESQRNVLFVVAAASILFAATQVRKTCGYTTNSSDYLGNTLKMIITCVYEKSSH